MRPFPMPMPTLVRRACLLFSLLSVVLSTLGWAHRPCTAPMPAHVGKGVAIGSVLGDHASHGSAPGEGCDHASMPEGGGECAVVAHCVTAVPSVTLTTEASSPPRLAQPSTLDDGRRLELALAPEAPPPRA